MGLLPIAVALYPLSSPNHNLGYDYVKKGEVALYPLSSPNHNRKFSLSVAFVLRYILFHHQTTTFPSWFRPYVCCVISSFITKPQRFIIRCFWALGCVISSFITKPQPVVFSRFFVSVALYPLSSPNHNAGALATSLGALRYILFHHQTTTFKLEELGNVMLRYILFHHQTTTR